MKFFQMGLTLSAALLISGVVNAQGGFGRFGGQGGGASAGTLINNPAVQKELKVSEEQLKKLPDAMTKAIGEVLDKDQLKRLNQIVLQQKGINAYKESSVQTALKLSGEQKESITTIMDDLVKETKDLNKGGFNRESFQKMATLRKEAREKIEGLLSAEQKSAWKDLVGDEFKMPAFGGFRPGQGGNNPQIRRPGQPGNQNPQPKKKNDA